MEAIEALRLDENNEIIDHLVAIQKILKRKCARCETCMGCMGCVFDGVDPSLMPASLDYLLTLMAHLPNGRMELVAEAENRMHHRRAKWGKMFKDKK